MNPPDVGRRVRAARAYAGSSRAQLAAASGVPRRELARIERGERAASAAELRAIMQSCGVDDAFFSAGPRTQTDPVVAARLRQLRGALDRVLQQARGARTEFRPVRDEVSAALDVVDPGFEGLDPRLIRVLEHPLRTRLLNSCVDAPRTAQELSDALGSPLADVVEQLEALVRDRAVVRVGEAAYQAAIRHMLDDRQMSYFPIAFRRSQYASILELLQDDVRAAMRAGGFDARSIHVSRRPLRVDGPGYSEMTELLREALLRVLQIDAESDARRTYGESEEDIETELAILHFHREPESQRIPMTTVEDS
jgi:transcriptional regulator with XRE-family HTH domain